MNLKLALSALIIAGSGFVAVPGCVADASDPREDGESEGIVASQDELTTSAARLVGAFHGAGGAARPPTFEGIVFQQSGDFFADVDTGLRCVRAPCPSHVRLVGRFRATRNHVRLSPRAGESPQSFHGLYRYTLANDKLTLSRAGAPWSAWANTLDKELSYCAQPTDCEAQSLIHPMCAGSWTCGGERSCGWSCGVPVPDAIWPADRTRLVAESPGGGFVPPAPPGSTCTLGARKYSLDVETRMLSWEVCEFSGPGTPLHVVTGSRTLSRAELEAVSSAMLDVKLATDEVCGADKPLLSIKVTSASQGTRTYTDSFYSCMGGDRTYVDHIDGVFSALGDLALRDMAH